MGEVCCDWFESEQKQWTETDHICPAYSFSEFRNESNFVICVNYQIYPLFVVYKISFTKNYSIEYFIMFRIFNVCIFTANENEK